MFISPAIKKKRSDIEFVQSDGGIFQTRSQLFEHLLLLSPFAGRQRESVRKKEKEREESDDLPFPRFYSRHKRLLLLLL